jgi:O-antigen/teichoic acid export membrane protein
MDTALLLFVGLLYGMAPLIVDILYPDAYGAAGWMLRLLCIRAATRCVTAICQQRLVAAGHPEYTFRSSLARALWTVPPLLVGWHAFGLLGVLVAVAIAELPALFVLHFGLNRLGLLSVIRETLALGAFLAGLAIDFGVEAAVGLVLPGLF